MGALQLVGLLRKPEHSAHRDLPRHGLLTDPTMAAADTPLPTTAPIRTPSTPTIRAATIEAQSPATAPMANTSRDLPAAPTVPCPLPHPIAANREGCTQALSGTQYAYACNPIGANTDWGIKAASFLPFPRSLPHALALNPPRRLIPQPRKPLRILAISEHRASALSMLSANWFKV